MKVLITGASGKLGAFVIRALRDDHEIVLTSRRRPDDEFADLPWIEGDLADFEVCQRAVEGVDAIQHIAAQPNPTDHPKLRERAAELGLAFDATFRANMMGTYYLMQAAVEVGVKTVIMAGSNCALGHGFRISGEPFPIERLPIDETHPCLPEDSYSYSKRAGEDLLAMYTRAYGIRTHVTRICGICPPERREAMAHNIKPAGAWNQWLWLWVASEDVADAHRLLMEKAEELPPHDVYFLNANDSSALEPTAELVEQYQPALRSFAEGLEGHASLISSQKLQDAVGWRPIHTWRTPQ